MSSMVPIEDRRRRVQGGFLCGDYGHIAHRKQVNPGPCMKPVKAGGYTGCAFHKDDPPTRVPDDSALGLAIEQRWALGGLFRQSAQANPAEVLLALITQSAKRVELYSYELGRLAAEADQLTLPPKQEAVLAAFKPGLAPEYTVEDIDGEGELAAVLAPEYAVVPSGDRVFIGRKISALAELEARERRDLAKLCKDALALGIEQRKVDAARSQGDNLAAVVRAMVSHLHLNAEQQRMVPFALQAAVIQVFGTQESVVDAEIV